jgi:exopolysaccharide production protein ExoY
MPIRPLRLDSPSVPIDEAQQPSAVPGFAPHISASELIASSEGLRVVTGGAPAVVRERPSRRGARRRTHELPHPLVVAAPRWKVVAKRAIDILGALVGLAIFALPLLVLAALIRLGSRGRPIFAHQRVGLHGRTFHCYKLRTMCVGAETLLAEDEPLQHAYRAHHFKLPLEVDPRVTPMGRFLRTSSLDEIPQFWNVLRGDMSLVGPRPVVVDELAHYDGARDVLLSVRPGLTGAWAVRGRSRVGYPQRAMMELDYVQTWTLAGDFAIMLRTIGVVLQRRGAF